MKIRTLVVDDELPARQLLSEYLSGYSELELIGVCCDGHDAVQVIQREAPDLVFLDIKMPGLDGFDVLKYLDPMPWVVFSTAYDAYALRAFEVDAVDYLLKPYDAAVVDRAVRRVLKKTQHTNPPVAIWRTLEKLVETPCRTLFVESRGQYIPIQDHRILAVKAQGDYTEILTAESRYLCRQGLGVLERQLDASRFIRIHRSSLVSIDAIASIRRRDGGSWWVYLQSDERIRVGRSYLAAVKLLVHGA